jgi:hypothetical protein
VALARASQAKRAATKVEFVSTVGVLGRQCRRASGGLDHDRREFHNTYEAAKAEARTPLGRRSRRVAGHRPSAQHGGGRLAHRADRAHPGLLSPVRFPLGQAQRDGSTRAGTRCGWTPFLPTSWASDLAWSSRQASTRGADPALCVPVRKDRSRWCGSRRWSSRSCDSAWRRCRHGRFASPARLFRILARVLELAVDDRTRRALRTLPGLPDYLESDPKVCQHQDGGDAHVRRDSAWPAPTISADGARLATMRAATGRRTRGVTTLNRDRWECCRVADRENFVVAGDLGASPEEQLVMDDPGRRRPGTPRAPAKADPVPSIT